MYGPIIWEGSVREKNGTILVDPAGEKLVKRYITIHKLSSSMGTQDSLPRAYWLGYGVLDANLNSIQDPGEKKVYFELNDYSTPFIFYEPPP